MTIYVKAGISYRGAADAELDVYSLLPPANYVLKCDQNGFFFEEVDDFDLPKKLYGDTVCHTDRILETFEKRPNSTGILLTGEKGSGKTLLAKNISIKARLCKMPTIIINSKFVGDDFNTVIQGLDQPCVILFDEFEKVYDRSGQESLLTLLDGVFPTKKIFILTCNDEHGINKNLLNRPGRLYYLIKYKGISSEFVREYCEDRLINKEHIPQVVKLRAMFCRFNFDMLTAIIEEMNRYNETPVEALRMLNVEPDNRESYFEISVEVDGTTLSGENVQPTPIWHQPITEPITVQYNSSGKDMVAPMRSIIKRPNAVSMIAEDFNQDDDAVPDNWDAIYLTPNDITRINDDGSVFYQKDGKKVMLKKLPQDEFNYLDRLRG